MKINLNKILLYLMLIFLTCSFSMITQEQYFSENLANSQIKTEKIKVINKEKDREIVLGMSAAFTGVSQALGKELYQGSMAYFNYLNHHGGINNNQIKIKAYDDEYDPISAIYNTIKLVEDDQVFTLFNYVGTPTVTRILPLLYRYRDDHIYLLFPFTGAQPQRQMPYQDLVFNLRASYRQETEGLVDHFIKIGRKKIAVFYQIDAYGRSGWDGVKRGLKKYNLDIIKEATYRRGTSYSASLKAQVNIIKSGDPDAIISIGSYEACAGFIRDARDQGLNIPIANISFVGSEKLLKLLEKTGLENNQDYTENLINSQVVPSYEDISLPAVKEYRQLMTEYKPSFSPPFENNETQSLDYSFTSFEGFLNAKIIGAILTKMQEKFGDYKPEYLPEIIEHINNLDLGINSPISFEKNNHQGLNKIYYTMIKNGKYIPFTDWEFLAKK